MTHAARPPESLAHPLVSGTAFALAAGLSWGLVFVGPTLLPDYPPTTLAFGRYLAFGLIVLPLAGFDRSALGQLRRDDWIEAMKLAVVGNLVYYLLLASAIQRAGTPMPTVIIGTLPVVISIVSNLRARRSVPQTDTHLPWRHLAPSLLLIASGIALVNQVELERALREAGDGADYAIGAALAVGALVCWTWYPIRNADWLRGHPDRNPRAWALAQGLVTLPLAAVGFVVAWWPTSTSWAAVQPVLGPRPGSYLMLILALGLIGSWLGTLCWNEASQRLPPRLAGQLIVFETISALLYTYLYRGTWPTATTLAGVALLLAGVAWALRSPR